MELVRKISFTLVLAVILLHSAIPHVHHNQMTKHENSISHNLASDFIDFLVLGFHNDLGSEDEYVVSTHQQNIEFSDLDLCDFIFKIVNINNDIHISEESFVSEIYIKPYSDFSLNCFGLRAPPTV